MSVFIKEINPKNILSFGPDTKPIQLGSLNILIGPNASGKSNLLDVIGILKSTPIGILNWMRPGVDFWKNNQSKEYMKIIAIINYEKKYESGGMRYFDLTHLLYFDIISGSKLEIAFDVVIYQPEPSEKGTGYSKLDYTKASRIPESTIHESLTIPVNELKSDESIMALGKDPAKDSIFDIANKYNDIRIYRDWYFGRKGFLRNAQSSEGRNDKLDEDFSNFFMFLAKFKMIPNVKRKIIEEMSLVYNSFTDFNVIPFAGSLLLMIEEGNHSIPASRISDGTLRYLALVAILCDSDPPPLICIEEPELGLHPDMINAVARLLREASERTQIIITTHSVELIDAFTETPEVVMVCEKVNHQTEIRRLEPDKLQDWLKEYRLGRVWMSGEIGGTRW